MPKIHDKVRSLFKDLVGDRAEVLDGCRFPAEINDRITAALLNGDVESNVNNVVQLDGIGFHLVDWNADAAFIVALHLFPEKFTDEEIREGIEMFLVHAPAHCLEAARLGGYSTQNIFEDEEESES